ncbi:hypothetical protein [Burkholderia ubonensis]|uniref:hypothetical protein n=1 Tax=Burkholderia ubonensis TaxID=101571 RepID=UPI0018DF92DF|nr:hypothetical protein [Burkholderia ubonensis]
MSMLRRMTPFRKIKESYQMNPIRIEQLRATFRDTHPELAKFFDQAKSQKEVEQYRELFINQARERLATLLGKSVEQLDDTDQTCYVALKPDELQGLLSASGDQIESLIHKYLDGLQRLKDMTNDDPYTVTAQVLFLGATAVGSIAISSAYSKLLQGATELVAAFAGVETATVAVVCAVAAIIVLMVVIPIIYYMEKPALCMVGIINLLTDEAVSESGDTTKYQLDFVDDHNDHGKPVLMTTPLPGAIDMSSIGRPLQAGIGFVATSKRDNALRGTQYGFTYKVHSGSPNLSFGVEDPLIFGDNAGYCAIGSDSQSAADAVDSDGNLDYSAEGSGYNLRIRCNSGSGDIAYYIATVSKG